MKLSEMMRKYAMGDYWILARAKEVAQLEAENEALLDAILEQQDTADARECPCRLHFKHGILASRNTQEVE